jgi:hypothetical protein
MPRIRLSRAAREGLLQDIAAGHDLASAQAKNALSDAQIASGGDKLQAEIRSAFQLGTSRLRAKLTALSLEKADAASLNRLLDWRERQTATDSGYEVITRLVVAPACARCGAPADEAWPAYDQRGLNGAETPQAKGGGARSGVLSESGYPHPHKSDFSEF